MSKMQKKLKEIADIQLGFPFRGKLEDLPVGEVCVIQPKDISNNGEINWAGVSKVCLPGRAKPLFLENGDIIIPAKGRDNSPKKMTGIAEGQLVVASPYFFTVRIASADSLDPLNGFVYWWLRQRPTQEYFSRYSAGSAVKNLTRAAIDEIPVILPTKNEMEQVIVSDVFISMHTETLNKLIKSNNKITNGIAQKLASKYSKPNNDLEKNIDDPFIIEDIKSALAQNDGENTQDYMAAALIINTGPEKNADKE